MKRTAKKIGLAAAIAAAAVAILSYPGYLVSKALFNRYFERWGERLVALEKRNLLSREFGAAWQDILSQEKMANEQRRLLEHEERGGDTIRVVDGIRVNDYPSLGIIRHLNEIHEYSNAIEILDRTGTPIADIRTDHTRATIDEFPPTLVTALIAAEDGAFRRNDLGFEFDSFVRAAGQSVWEALTTGRLSVPSGTSTITQQVAKLFISDIDEEGRRYVSRTLERKLREMRLAAALRKMYTPDEILEVYLNHCVTSDYGLIGFKDIAAGLLGKELNELSDAECIYLARMVKWGRNLHGKIAAQCRIDMPRMAASLGWDRTKQQEVLARIDSLTFQKPRQVHTDHGALVDLANEFWLDVLRDNGLDSAKLADMNIIDPNSLIRRKGNLTIELTVDLGLQRRLEQLVRARGYGPDTVIVTDVRIGSHGENVTMETTPRDTLRRIQVLREPGIFSEMGSDFTTELAAGDTLVTNVRYRRLGGNRYRRSVFYYTRRPVEVDGQYFAYAIMDSRSGELLAYYSRDRIGSRLAGLLRNRTPNGSSTAKPIFNALNFDLGVFRAYEMWTDRYAVTEDVPWKRTIDYHGSRPIGVTFANSAVKGKGYKVHNHGHIFEGCRHVFEHLATSNNILGAETVYRLNRRLFGPEGRVRTEALPLIQFFQRINAFGRVRDSLGLKHVTGVRVYKELARIAGVDINSMEAYGKRVPVSDSMYSIGLGTLELTLYEQMHIFNMLYNNDLIEHPASHPSLVIRSIVMGGDSVTVRDTVRRYHPFASTNNLRPTYLGMHKRLVSNRWDGLGGYDISSDSVSYAGPVADSVFSPDAFRLKAPLSNYAKSGTSDDVIRPFNVDVTSKKRTNYGLWNAVIRVDLSAFADRTAPEVRDITIACVGECNQQYTGARDGKSLHKFVSRELLKTGGRTVPPGDGYFNRYEHYLETVTPDSLRYCGHAPAVDTSLTQRMEP